jgi:hypothetical protein
MLRCLHDFGYFTFIMIPQRLSSVYTCRFRSLLFIPPLYLTIYTIEWTMWLDEYIWASNFGLEPTTKSSLIWLHFQSNVTVAMRRVYSACGTSHLSLNSASLDWVDSYSSTFLSNKQETTSIHPPNNTSYSQQALQQPPHQATSLKTSNPSKPLPHPPWPYSHA